MNPFLIIGSVAIKHHFPDFRDTLDLDFMASSMLKDTMLSDPDFKLISDNKMTYTAPTGKIVEYNFVNSESDQMIMDYCHVRGVGILPADACLMMKLSHRYKKNSVHFMKTMLDIHFLRSKGVVLNPELEHILKIREKETYNYSSPSLNQPKDTFFQDSGKLKYMYDHDSIHAAVAVLTQPAYTQYSMDGEEVLSDEEKFIRCSRITKLLGVYEEACVLALERYLIPNGFVDTVEHHDKAFIMALEKVCTSITSGWFREYAWENYFAVVDIHNELGVSSYVERFVKNQHKVIPFKENDYDYE